MWRRHWSVGLLLLVTLFWAPALDVAAAAPPRVRLITTGGTISNRPGARLSPDELVALVPDLGDLAEVETEEFANIVSSAVTLDQWLRLARRLNQAFREDGELAGIVVTSGTDTLEELAYFLHLTVHTDRPVVVVGAMRRPGTLGYDGAANLRQAFQVAGAPASRGRGTLVVLNGDINSARDVTKTDANHLQTFESRRYGILGSTAGDRVIYYRRPEQRHSADTEFDVARVTRLPRVEIVMSYQGASGDLVRAAADLGVDGLVIAGAGAGAVSAGQRDAIAYALERGVPVVMTTRTGRGRIAPRPPRAEPTDDRSANTRGHRRISGEDLAPVKARVLLMLALTATSDRNELQRIFTEY
jgi:L-asparaginase